MSARLALIAGMLSGLLVLGACLGALHWLLLPERFPVTSVELNGTLKNTSAAQIRAALPRAAENFFAVDLAEVRASVEKLPWVRRVTVRRVWPGRLEVSVEEHVALARWGGDALVNTHGERFSGKTDQVLPLFIAPAGHETEVTLRYGSFKALLAPLGVEPERVVLSQRLAWQLRLSNGLHVMLGRDGDQAEARLRRFVGVHDATLKAMQRKHEYVDLRYPNGFALRVPELKG